MSDLFFSCYWTVVAITFAITVVQGLLVYQLHQYYPQHYEELGKPSVGYFLFGRFFLFEKYARSILSFSLFKRFRKNGGSLLIESAVMTMLFYGLLVSWSVGIMAALQR